MSLHGVHIVCEETPYPADCGDAIDTYEKIRALHDAGVSVHLHMKTCNGDSTRLCDCCASVETYQTDHTKGKEDLVEKLIASPLPVLLENFYDCRVVEKLLDTGKRVVIRVRDEEGYMDREKKCGGGFRELWRKKQHVAHAVANGCIYACTFPQDAKFLSDELGVRHAPVLAPFVSWSACESRTGAGNFCLYHGDLSHPCNEKIALMLLEQVFSKCRYPFVIAGKNPSRRIAKLAEFYSHTCLVANPESKVITELVQKAHINIVPSLQPGRIYKLLHSVFRGRHCIANNIALEGTGLDAACHVASDTEAIIRLVERLMTMPFEPGEIELREQLLFPTYDNRANAARLKKLLFNPAYT